MSRSNSKPLAEGFGDMAITIARYLTSQCVQGSADAFIQDSITTGLVPADGFAFKITKMLVDWSVGMSNVNASERQLSLTRDTKTTITRYDDPDCLFFFGEQSRLATSGWGVSPEGYSFDFPDGLYVVEPTIYLQVDSALTTFTYTVNARLYYEEVRLSEVEILRLLNNV